MALCITDIKQVLEFFGFSLSLLRGVVVDENCNVNDDNKKYKEEEEKKINVNDIEIMVYLLKFYMVSSAKHMAFYDRTALCISACVANGTHANCKPKVFSLPWTF